MRLKTPCSDSLSLRLASKLNLAACDWLAGSFYKRHAVTELKSAPTACGRAVSGTVSLPSRGAFHLSLAVLVRYRSQGGVQAWRVVPPASRRVPRARRYSGPRSGRGRGFAYGAVTLCRRPSHAVRLPVPFVTPAGGLGPPVAVSRNPVGAAPPRPVALDGLAVGRFRSPLLPASRLVSPPRGT